MKTGGQPSYTVAEILAWLGACAASVVGTTTFVYQNFETKVHADERKNDVISRLDRITDYIVRVDQKLDQIQRGNKR